MGIKKLNPTLIGIGALVLCIVSEISIIGYNNFISGIRRSAYRSLISRCESYNRRILEARRVIYELNSEERRPISPPADASLEEVAKKDTISTSELSSLFE